MRGAINVMVQFQSTPSEGRATFFHSSFRVAEIISIHALRGEGDVRTVPQ